MSKTRTALVTGASGFIGSFLVEKLLAERYRVRCLALPGEKLRWIPEGSVEVVRGDVRDKQSLVPSVTGADVVFHLAGLVKAPSYEAFRLVNALGTANLLDAVLTYNPRVGRLVFVSSQAAGGPAASVSRPSVETDPASPVSFYGHSKREAEELAAPFMARGLPVTILRPASVYGPRDAEFFAYFRSVKRFRVKPLIGHGDQCLNLIYAGDLAEALVRAAESPDAAGKTYYVCGEGTYSWRDVGGLIEKLVGRKAVFVRLPAWMAKIAGAANDVLSKLTGRARMFTGSKVREALAACWVCSSAAAKREIAFAPKVGLEEGLRLSYEWYVREGWL